MAYERIEMNPEIMGGKPVIRGRAFLLKRSCENLAPA